MSGILYIYIVNRCGVQTWILKIRLDEDRADGKQPVSEAKKEKRTEKDREKMKEKESRKGKRIRKYKTEGTARGRGGTKVDKREKRQGRKRKGGDRMTG